MAIVPLQYNIRSLFVRSSSTILTVLAVGATIAVLAGMLSLQQGFAVLFQERGRTDLALFMRQGEDTPLPVPTGEFEMPESDAAAQARGRSEAQAIVAATLAPSAATPGSGSHDGASGE